MNEPRREWLVRCGRAAVAATILSGAGRLTGRELQKFLDSRFGKAGDTLLAEGIHDLVCAHPLGAIAPQEIHDLVGTHALGKSQRLIGFGEFEPAGISAGIIVNHLSSLV